VLILLSSLIFFIVESLPKRPANSTFLVARLTCTQKKQRMAVAFLSLRRDFSFVCLWWRCHSYMFQSCSWYFERQRSHSSYGLQVVSVSVFRIFMSNLRFSVVLEALDNAEPAFTRKSSYVCAFVLLCICVFVY
jgi:hypothetical protein